MIYLYSYQKSIDSVTTHTLRLPEAPQGTQSGQEIATLEDGRTIVVIYDGFTLGTQPAQITVVPLVLTPVLRAEIKAASPHVRLINANVQAAIAERYSIAMEIKLLRTGPSPEFDAYNAYVEECRAIGAAEKAKLGL